MNLFPLLIFCLTVLDLAFSDCFCRDHEREVYCTRFVLMELFDDSICPDSGVQKLDILDVKTISSACDDPLDLHAVFPFLNTLGINDKICRCFCCNQEKILTLYGDCFPVQCKPPVVFGGNTTGDTDISATSNSSFSATANVGLSTPKTPPPALVKRYF